MSHDLFEKIRASSVGLTPPTYCDSRSPVRVFLLPFAVFFFETEQNPLNTAHFFDFFFLFSVDGEGVSKVEVGRSGSHILRNLFIPAIFLVRLTLLALLGETEGIRAGLVQWLIFLKGKQELSVLSDISTAVAGVRASLFLDNLQWS